MSPEQTIRKPVVRCCEESAHTRIDDVGGGDRPHERAVEVHGEDRDEGRCARRHVVARSQRRGCPRLRNRSSTFREKWKIVVCPTPALPPCNVPRQIRPQLSHSGVSVSAAPDPVRGQVVKATIRSVSFCSPGLSHFARSPTQTRSSLKLNANSQR